MDFKLRGRGVRLTADLIDHTESRLRASLERFDDRVREVRISLTDVNGPRGGEDIECRIEARLSPGGSLLAHAISDDPFVAVARAGERIQTGVGRRVERMQSLRRRSRGSAISNAHRTPRPMSA